MAPHTTPDGNPDDSVTSHRPQAPSSEPPTTADADPLIPPTSPPAQNSLAQYKPRRASATTVARVRKTILARIADGTWSGDNFPTMQQIQRELRVGLHAISEAYKGLEKEKVLHKVKKRRAPGERGRLMVWRPVDVASEEPEDDALQFENDVRSGAITGQLPTIGEVAKQCRVANGVISDAYRRLRADGLIDQVWTPDFTRRVWYAFNDSAGSIDPARLRTGDCKALAIAEDLVQRMPEWLVRAPRGGWYRTTLPQLNDLRVQYRTHVYSVERALTLLVRLKILERPVATDQVYLPRPPADRGAGHGVQFSTDGSYRGRDWYRAPEETKWLPLPTSKDDVVVASIKERHSQYREERESRRELLKERGLL